MILSINLRASKAYTGGKIIYIGGGR